jgi:hypothetical protein
LKEKEQNMSIQMVRQRRTWLLIPPVHTTVFIVQWLLWQLLLVEAHPLIAPIGYIVGGTFVLGILTSLAPVTCTIALALIGYGPRAVTAMLIGVASGTISHTLLRSWLLLGLPEGDLELWQLLFVQNSLALILVVGIYAINRIRSIAIRAT